MSVRPVIALAAIVLSVAGTPVFAGEGKVLDGLNSRSMESKVGSPDRSAAAVLGSNVPKGSYTSGNVGVPPTTLQDQAPRTINVWGARFDVPVR